MMRKEDRDEFSRLTNKFKELSFHSLIIELLYLEDDSDSYESDEYTSEEFIKLYFNKYVKILLSRPLSNNYKFKGTIYSNFGKEDASFTFFRFIKNICIELVHQDIPVQNDLANYFRNYIKNDFYKCKITYDVKEMAEYFLDRMKNYKKLFSNFFELNYEVTKKKKSHKNNMTSPKPKTKKISNNFQYDEIVKKLSDNSENKIPFYNQHDLFALKQNITLENKPESKKLENQKFKYILNLLGKLITYECDLNFILDFIDKDDLETISFL